MHRLNSCCPPCHPPAARCATRPPGKEIWRAKNKNGVSGGGMIHGGTYFAGSWNQNVQSIDLATGKTNWKVDVKGAL